MPPVKAGDDDKREENPGEVARCEGAENVGTVAMKPVADGLPLSLIEPILANVRDGGGRRCRRHYHVGNQLHATKTNEVSWSSK